MKNGNREYKSDVFSMLMEDKRNALSVYNALNNSSIDDPELVDICTLEKGISLTVRNDAAFIVDASLSVYEHQSTLRPNMPMRSLIYFSYMVDMYVTNQNLYESKEITIPNPQFVVIYNGDIEQPELQEYRLLNDKKLDVVCKVYNTKAGKNELLLDECIVLRDYMTFVDNVRYYYSEQDYEDLARATHRAIDKCMKDNVLAEFLQENRDEVVQAITSGYEYDREVMLRLDGAVIEGREEGLAEAHAEAHAEGLALGRTQTKKEDAQKIAAKFNISIDEALSILNGEE